LKETALIVRDRIVDVLFGLLFAAVIVGSLVVIGNIQANQYRQIVSRIDQNAALTSRGTQAVVCVLQIDPSKATTVAEQHEAIRRCLAKYGLDTGP
jgi:hypothetical protein